MEQSVQRVDDENRNQRIPALVLSRPESSFRIANVSIIDRLVVAIHRAGAGPITIYGSGKEDLKRSRALGIPFELVTKPPYFDKPWLVAFGDLLVQTTDVKRCLEMNARLVQNGVELPIGIHQPDLFKHAVDNRDIGDAVSMFAGVTPVEANAVAQVVSTKADLRQTERALWASLTSAADGFVDRHFNRPIGRFLSKILIYTPVSPNAVSICSILIGVISALFFAEGSYQCALFGALLFQLSAIIDCVDGDLARILFKESPLGKWIDFWGDQIVHVSVFAGIAFGVLRNGGGKETVWLGLSAILGVLIAGIVVVRGMRLAGANSALQKLIDAATNRDFSVLVLALAAMQKLHWFLWLAGIGSHFFWLTALALQLRQTTTPPAR